MKPAESAEPERPAGLPEAGFWNPSVGKWEVSPQGADGARDGERLLYRLDGSLHSRTRLVAGVPEGPFAVYHRDGRVASEGRFVAGLFDGLITSHASDDPAGEPLRSCCVPPGAARYCQRYEGGDFLVETFYDSQGRALLADGRPCPLRPASLPELAEFDEAAGRWALRTRRLDRTWTLDGTLLEEVERTPDGGRIVRAFDGGGQICEVCGYAADGKRHGVFLRRLAPGTPGLHADERIREERGGFERGQAVGVWTFHDGGGGIVREIDRGLPFPAGPEADSPAFADDIEDGWGLARRLLAGRRVREALCAAARGAARSADRAGLARFLADHLVALAPQGEAERGDALADDSDAAALLDELMQGADAAAIFRALGARLPATRAAAADLVEASLLLAPERRLTHLTRALIRIERGDESGARAALAAVESEPTDDVASLGMYLRMVFRPFELSATRQAVAAGAAGAGPGDPSTAIAQTLEAIRRLAAVYATRLLCVRDAVRARLGAGTPGTDPQIWLPPDLSSLLPAGPIPLRRETIACDPDEGTSEPETIELDEQIVTEGLGVPALLGLARADFCALTWLCWSAGLDGVALPGAIAPPPELAAAMQAIVTRTWRACDRLATGGLLAAKHGVASFAWQGIDIDLLPRPLVESAATELRAAQSMFLWLTTPDTLSPFQDDIRGV